MLRMKSPFGPRDESGTLATFSSVEMCRAAMKNQTLSFFTGPPSDPLKFWMCTMPLALVMFWLLR